MRICLITLIFFFNFQLCYNFEIDSAVSMRNIFEDLTSIKDCSSTINLQRFILKEGFHRDIQTIIHLPSISSGTVLLLEHFSQAIYLDKYQLKELERFGAQHRVRLLQEIDLEKPAAFSTPNYAFIFKEIASDRFNITIPIHFRYQNPSSDARYISVEIQSPKVFLLSDGQSKWKLLCTSSMKEGELRVNIPTGEADKEEVVSMLTTITTLLGASIVGYYIYSAT